jgi:hypothetical protein
VAARRFRLAAGACLAAIAAAFLAEAWRSPVRASLSAEIHDDGGSAAAAQILLTRPVWLRPGGEAEVELEVKRLAPVASGPASPRALVARLSGLGARVTPAEEQAASWSAADQWRFTWRVQAAGTAEPGASLSLSLRDYVPTAAAESVVWARLLGFEVRPPLVAPGVSVLVLAAGAALMLTALRRSG